MKKELLIHFSFFISLFIFISLFKGYLDLSYWPFWAGGLIGTLLPDVDHFIYVYFLKPHELTSKRVSYMLGKKDLFGSLSLLAETRSERTKLIFHTATFQIIFMILTFFVITSSGSLLGRGLVLSFSLHLLIDQVVDLSETGNFDIWFKDLPIEFGLRNQKIYWWAILILVLIFGFLM